MWRNTRLLVTLVSTNAPFESRVNFCLSRSVIRYVRRYADIKRKLLAFFTSILLTLTAAEGIKISKTKFLDAHRIFSTKLSFSDDSKASYSTGKMTSWKTTDPISFDTINVILNCSVLLDKIYKLFINSFGTERGCSRATGLIWVAPYSKIFNIFISGNFKYPLVISSSLRFQTSALERIRFKRFLSSSVMSIQEGRNFTVNYIDEGHDTTGTILSAAIIENDVQYVRVPPPRPRWRRLLRSQEAEGGRTRNVVARDYMHARYIARERRRTRMEGEIKRHTKETERKGGIQTEEEGRGGWQTRTWCGSPHGIRITLGCRNYCPVGRGRAANGTGCFALVETADKSRKLNRRHRLSIGVPRGRRMRHVGHKENRGLADFTFLPGTQVYLDT